MIRYVALGMFSIFFYGEKKVGICSFFSRKKNLCYYVNNYALVNIMLQIISSVFERQFTTYYNISTQLLLYELPNPYLVADDAGDISRDIRRNVKMHLCIGKCAPILMASHLEKYANFSSSGCFRLVFRHYTLRTDEYKKVQIYL